MQTQMYYNSKCLNTKYMIYIYLKTKIHIGIEYIQLKEIHDIYIYIYIHILKFIKSSNYIHIYIYILQEPLLILIYILHRPQKKTHFTAHLRNPPRFEVSRPRWLADTVVNSVLMKINREEKKQRKKQCCATKMADHVIIIFIFILYILIYLQGF